MWYCTRYCFKYGTLFVASLQYPFLATISSAGRFSCPFPSVFFPCSSSSDRVSGFVSFRFVYVATLAGFVADLLM